MPIKEKKVAVYHLCIDEASRVCVGLYIGAKPPPTPRRKGLKYEEASKEAFSTVARNLVYSPSGYFRYILNPDGTLTEIPDGVANG